MGERFCYRCGIGEEEGGPLVDGLCQVCFRRENPVLKVPEKIRTEVCRNCGSYKSNGKWLDPTAHDPEGIIREAAWASLRESLAFDERVREVEFADPDELDSLSELPVGKAVVGIEFLSRRTDSFPFVLVYRVRVRARIHRDQRILHDEEKVVTVQVGQTVCPRCQKFLTGYFEAILQVRAEGRRLSRKERDRVGEIVEKAVERVMKNDRMGFIQDTVEKVEGLDFYVGSKKAARKVAQSIVDRMGGRITEAYELVGMDRQTSREVYRTSVTVRIPKFREGDVVKDDRGNVYEVEEVNGRGLKLKNLKDWSVTHLDWKTTHNRNLNSVDFEEERAMVTSVQIKEIQLMDMESYRTYEMERPPFDVEEGEIYSVVSTREGRYLRKKVQ